MSDAARVALAAALPIDPDDGTVIIGYEWHGGGGGDPAVGVTGHVR